MPKKLKDIKRFDLSNYLTTDPNGRVSEWSASPAVDIPIAAGNAESRFDSMGPGRPVSMTGPEIAPAKSASIDLGLAQPSISTPESISLKNAQGLDLDSMPDRGGPPAQTEPGVFHAGDMYRGGRDGGKGMKNTLATIVRLVTGAGRGMSAADEQRFPTLLGGIGKAADMLHRDEEKAQAMQMAQRRYQDDLIDKERRYNMDREAHEINLEKAGYEADLAKKNLEHYDTVMDYKRLEAEDRLIMSAFDRHLRKAMEERHVSESQMKRDLDESRIVINLAQAKMLDEQAAAKVPTSTAKLNTARAVEIYSRMRMAETNNATMLENDSKRANAAAEGARAAMIRAVRGGSEGYGGSSYSSLGNTYKSLMKEISDAEIKVSESVYMDHMTEQQEKVYRENVIGPMMEEANRMRQVLEVMGSRRPVTPEAGTAIPGEGAGVATSGSGNVFPGGPDPLNPLNRTNAGAF